MESIVEVGLRTRGYQILRKPDQADDSLDAFEWQPSKDSDDLFDALKKAFPRGASHKCRMRDALIDFLVREREAEQKPRQIVPPETRNDGSSSTVKVDVPELPSQQNNGRISPYAAVVRPPRTVNGSGPTPPETPDSGIRGPRNRRPKDWDTMTVVWTSESGLARAQRPKKKMTEEERKSYQLRRVRGACVACKRSKRKCTHDSPYPNGPASHDNFPSQWGPSSKKGTRKTQNTHAVSQSQSRQQDSSYTIMKEQGSSEIQTTFNTISPPGYQTGISGSSQGSFSSPGAQSGSMLESSRSVQSPLSSTSARSPPNQDFLALNVMNGSWIDSTMGIDDQLHMDSSEFDKMISAASPILQESKDPSSPESWQMDHTTSWWPPSINAMFTGLESYLEVPEPEVGTFDLDSMPVLAESEDFLEEFEYNLDSCVDQIVTIDEAEEEEAILKEGDSEDDEDEEESDEEIMKDEVKAEKEMEEENEEVMVPTLCQTSAAPDDTQILKDQGPVSIPTPVSPYTRFSADLSSSTAQFPTYSSFSLHDTFKEPNLPTSADFGFRVGGYEDSSQPHKTLGEKAEDTTSSVPRGSARGRGRRGAAAVQAAPQKKRRAVHHEKADNVKFDRKKSNNDSGSQAAAHKTNDTSRLLGSSSVMHDHATPENLQPVGSKPGLSMKSFRQRSLPIPDSYYETSHAKSSQPRPERGDEHSYDRLDEQARIAPQKRSAPLDRNLIGRFREKEQALSSSISYSDKMSMGSTVPSISKPETPPELPKSSFELEAATMHPPRRPQPKMKKAKMSLGEFLGDQTLGSWGDETDNDAPTEEARVQSGDPRGRVSHETASSALSSNDMLLMAYPCGQSPEGRQRSRRSQAFQAPDLTRLAANPYRPSQNADIPQAQSVRRLSASSNSSSTLSWQPPAPGTYDIGGTRSHSYAVPNLPEIPRDAEPSLIPSTPMSTSWAPNLSSPQTTPGAPAPTSTSGLRGFRSRSVRKASGASTEIDTVESFVDYLSSQSPSSNYQPSLEQAPFPPSASPIRPQFHAWIPPESRMSSRRDIAPPGAAPKLKEASFREREADGMSTRFYDVAPSMAKEEMPLIKKEVVEDENEIIKWEGSDLVDEVLGGMSRMTID